MKALLAAVAVLATVPVSAANSAQQTGVSNDETTIPSGGITLFAIGKSDTIYVRDVRARWYRVSLNKGCLKDAGSVNGLAFETGPASNKIDRLTSVKVYLTGGYARNCAIRSIVRSAAPPQYDVKSPIPVK